MTAYGALVPIARDRGSPAAGGAIDGHQRATRDTAFSLCFGSGSHLTPCWSKPDSNSRSHPLTRRQTDGSDPPHPFRPNKFIAPADALAAVSLPQSSNAATLVSSAASAQVGGSSSF